MRVLQIVGIVFCLVVPEYLLMYSLLCAAQLFNCVDCLPDVAKQFVGRFCDDKGKEGRLKNPPAPSERITDTDRDFQASKGSLLQSTTGGLRLVNFCPRTPSSNSRRLLFRRRRLRRPALEPVAHPEQREESEARSVS